MWLSVCMVSLLLGSTSPGAPSSPEASGDAFDGEPPNVSGGQAPVRAGPQSPVHCSGIPCSHTAHRELLVSEISFALRVQDPQHPLLGPTPTLQEWGRYWVPRAPRLHQLLARLSLPQLPSPGPVGWPSQAPGAEDRCHGSWGD